MKKLLVGFLTIAIISISSCALAPVKRVCKICPVEDILIKVPFEDGELFVGIPKGYLDNPENYITKEEFMEHLQKLNEEKLKEKEGKGI